MNYTLKRLSIWFNCLIIIGAGGLAVTMGLALEEPMPLVIAFGLLIGGSGLFVLRRELGRLRRFQTMNWEWYRETHPTCAGTDGIRCYKCQSRQVNARALRARTFHREHFCGQCGATLYFSPEPIQ